MLNLVIALCLVVFFYLVAYKPYKYWSIKGVKQVDVCQSWLGTLNQILLVKPAMETLKKLYSSFPNDRYVGVYQFMNPLFMLRDPDLIKQITVKDFDHFIDHYQFIPSDSDTLFTQNLFNLQGDKWKDMRTTLTPSFTSSKMKTMFGLISECAENFIHFFKSSETITVELKDAFTRYTNDVIASVAFGVTCDSLKEPNNYFYIMGKKTTNVSGFWRSLSFTLMILFPKISKSLGIKVFSKEIQTFFTKLVMDNIKSREQNGISRPDMIQLLMEAKNGRLKQMQDAKSDAELSMIKRQLTDEDLTAQALIFFFAGFESVSTLMCFTAYELAVDPTIQDKLQREVDSTLKECEGKITYEALQKMEYLDMVLSETLRKWPSAITTDRLCIKPYTIEPKTDEEKAVHLKKGEIIWIPIAAIHYDEQFYAEPQRFDPERFSHENKSKIHPYTYLPFGAGPRNCIGNRFALLETKLIFFNILKEFDIVVVDKSVIPLKLSRKHFNPNSEDGFWFGLKPRNVST